MLAVVVVELRVGDVLVETGVAVVAVAVPELLQTELARYLEGNLRHPSTQLRLNPGQSHPR